MDWFTEFPELGRRDLRDFRKSIDQGLKTLQGPTVRILSHFSSPYFNF